MADINNVTLSVSGAPIVKYKITYTKSRPNNSKMTYNFNISASLGASGSHINEGYALMCTITINGTSSQVRIKENDNDNWQGTTPRVRTLSVTCSSSSGGTTQGVRFRVVSDGRLTLSAGVIDNSEYTVLSSPLLTTACGAPTACSLSFTLSEGNTMLSWSGAAGGTNNAIESYEIQYSDSSNNSSWGNWTALSTVTSAKTSETLSVSPPATRGNYRRFRVRTRGVAGESYYSSWLTSSNTVRKNTLPISPSTATASPEVYSFESITLSWSGASGGTSSIKGYTIRSRTSTNGMSWTGWSTLETIDLSAASGSKTVTASSVAGTYTQYGVKTIDALGASSTEKISNIILCVPAACDTPTIIAPKPNSYTYNSTPRILISMGSQPTEQVLCMKINNGAVQDSVNNHTMFSHGGLIAANTNVAFISNQQTRGNITATVNSLNSDFEAPSNNVACTFTILSSPFETIIPNETKVKATHILAMRTAINRLRSYYGLSAFIWSGEVQKGKTYVYRWTFHIIEIRKAIEPIVEFINNFDTSSSFDLPQIDWELIENGRPKASAVNQIKNLILSL